MTTRASIVASPLWILSVLVLLPTPAIGQYHTLTGIADALLDTETNSYPNGGETLTLGAESTVSWTGNPSAAI